MKARKLILLVAGLAAVVAVAGVSYASIPGSNGVITACKDQKGTLKVIDAEAGQACAGNQQQLSWNQQGPAGDAGYERIEVTDDTAGTLVARVNGVRLEMAGVGDALRVVNIGAGTASYACAGIDGDLGDPIHEYGFLPAGSSASVTGNAHQPLLLNCTLVDRTTGETAQAFLANGGAAWYVGHVISDSAQ